jgi:hypothetical protein
MMVRGFVSAGLLAVPLVAFSAWPQSAPSGSSSSVQHPRRAVPSEAAIDAGSVTQGVYRNKTFGFACKIPAGWVLRTDELNARGDSGPENSADKAGAQSGSERVLLAAFARPPLAKGEDVNSSILIAAESASAYPGLKEAAQYFGPVTEVAKAQGFSVDEEPYAFAVGAKALVRGDFEKNVGSRVMRQSTLVMLAKGYAVSFTFIGGTEDEVEELIAGLSFAGAAKPQAH